MDEEQQLIQERERGLAAERILNEPIWDETWKRYSENLRARMEDPNTPDDIVLESRRMLLVVRRVRKDIETIWDTGKMANMTLEVRQDGRASA